MKTRLSNNGQRQQPTSSSTHHIISVLQRTAAPSETTERVEMTREVTTAAVSEAEKKAKVNRVKRAERDRIIISRKRGTQSPTYESNSTPINYLRTGNQEKEEEPVRRPTKYARVCKKNKGEQMKNSEIYKINTRGITKEKRDISQTAIKGPGK